MSVTLSTPEGPIALAETYLANMLADSARFRTLTGTADRATALKRIHFGHLPTPNSGGEYTRGEMEALRPFALVFTDDEDGYGGSLNAVSDHYDYTDRGAIMAFIEMDVPENIQNNPAEVRRRFNNDVGTIFSEMDQMAGQADYLAVLDRSMVMGPARSHEDDEVTRGDYVAALLRFTY